MKRRSLVVALACLTAAGAAFAQTSVPAPIQATDLPPAPKVTLTTTMGVIEITLDPIGAPKTSAHMLNLFQSPHYIGAAVFRIEPGFLIQLGDSDAQFKYRWPPGKPVELETATNRHFKGGVSLAHGEDPNSGHSSFYFDMAENASLNADPKAPPNTTGYATFGRVTAGMEVLEAITKVERAPGIGPFPGKAPLVPITITAIQTDPPPPPPARPAPVVKAKAKATKARRVR